MTDTSLPPKSRDLVRLYAAELLDKGHEVSQTAIREMILVRNGVTASPNLVVDELKSFWADTGPLLNKRFKRPGVPVSVCMSFDAIWDRALEAAQETSRHQQAHSEEIKRIKLLHDGEVERMQVAQEKLQRDLIEQAESFQAP